jgi:folate-dependent phosphoribosylglycinamide formyltransferase PurN
MKNLINHKKYYIYFIGTNFSPISTIFLENLIRFKNKSNYEIDFIIDSSNIKKIDLKNKFARFLYFFFNKRYYNFLTLLNYLGKNSLFIQSLKNEINFSNYNDFLNKKIKQNSILISCGGNKIFKKKFLNKFKIAINYHHSKIPEFRGVYTNGFEILTNKKNTYFTWHYINKKIDKGFPIFEEKIRINKKKQSMFFYDLLKIKKSSKNIQRILESAVKNIDKKKFESKKGNYYTKKYFKNYFKDLKKINYEFLEKFIRIFGGFYYKGQFITKIIRNNKKGILLLNSKIEIKEIKNLPILIYKILNFLKLIN